MGEFGHSFGSANGVHIDAWGTGPFVITADGREFTFEDSDRFGPVVLTKRLEQAYVQPATKSAFWRNHRIWVRQGRRTQPDGMTCIWDEPKPWYYEMRGRSKFIVENGDEDGEFLLRSSPSPPKGGSISPCDSGGAE